MPPPREVLELFERYCNLLDGEFRTDEYVSFVNTELTALAAELYQNGFWIFVSTRLRRIVELTDGREIVGIEQYRTMFLIPIPGHNPKYNNATPVAIKTAVAKIYPPESRDVSSLPDLSRTVETLLKSVDDPRQVDNEEHIWKRDWHFTEEECHALLASLNRHYSLLIEAKRKDDLLKEAVEKPVSPGSQEELTEILISTTIMAPAKVDVFTFSFLVDSELEYLLTLEQGGQSEIIDCGCEIGSHTKALETWRDRNLR